MATLHDQHRPDTRPSGKARRALAYAGLISLIASSVGIGPAVAQNRMQSGAGYMTMPPLVSVPGQDIGPPKPRQNLIPPPPPVTRPLEGDSTTRIRNDYRSRMPAPAMPNQ